MIRYTIKMQHDEKTFEALSRMQYDLFCSSNRITRTILSILLIAAGIVNFTQWWGILLAAYGCYLTTSTYSAMKRKSLRSANFWNRKAERPSAGKQFRFCELCRW